MTFNNISSKNLVGLRVGLALTALSGLSACGGSANDNVGIAPAIGFFDATSQETSELQGNALSTSSRSIAPVTGEIDRAANTASIGGASGTINASRSVIALAAGGSIALENGANTFSARYKATPALGSSTLGIIGVATEVVDMPGGSASYTGTSKLAIQDGANFYDLNGTANVAANFDTGTVTTTLNGLNGTRISGLAAAENVANVATVVVSGSTVSGNGFAGGSAAVTSSSLAAVSGSANTQIGGTFFGSQAAETGGTLVINDTTAGSVLIMGDFLAKQ